MGTPIATIAELEERIDWELDADEVKLATTALADLSDWARFHSGAKWGELGVPAPDFVKMLVLSAAVRYLRNPDGYTQSRAGDEYVQWGFSIGEDAGAARFTENEIKALRSVAKSYSSVGVMSVGLAFAPAAPDSPLYVRTLDPPGLFPYWAREDDGWRGFMVREL